jgi:hypothetical protein
MKKLFKIFVVTMVLVSAVAVSFPALAEENAGAETTTNVNFVGTLLEIGSTEVPTTMVVRYNNTDYVISVTSSTLLGQRWDQQTKLSDWIPGDAIRVIGVKDENTGVIDARILINTSIVVWLHRGVNGWVQSIDTAKNQVTVTYGLRTYVLQVTDKTNIYLPGKGKVTINDLKIGDRVRARALKRFGSSVLEAKIILVLRRGNVLFHKPRVNVFNAELLETSGTTPPTTIKVKILESPTLKSNDINNLIGMPGNEKTINVTENTILVRRWFGRTTLDEFVPGDKLMIVGKVNDDGTVTAKLIRDNDIWRASTMGVPGEITSIDVANNQFVVSWLGKTVTVKVTSETKIVVGENNSATISDLKVGDLVRGRGVWSATSQVLTADVIVVVSSLE